jgi:hypothetical protein
VLPILVALHRVPGLKPGQSAWGMVVPVV